MDYTREKMGGLLVRHGLITDEQLDIALAEQAVHGGKLGEVLVRGFALSEEQIAAALAEQKGLPLVNLAAVEIDRSAVVLLPWRMARLRGVIPIAFNDGRLVLAMSDPLDVEAIDETEIRTGFKVDIVVATASQVLYAIEKYAVASDTLQQLEEDDESDVDETRTSAIPAPPMKCPSFASSTSFCARPLLTGRATCTSSRKRAGSASATASTACFRMWLRCQRARKPGSPVASRSWPTWTSPSGAARRTAASRSESTGNRSTCAWPPCRPRWAKVSSSAF